VPTSIEVWGAQVADAPPERGTKPDFRVYGRVFSPRAKCTRLRRIDLFNVRDGSKIKIGSGFSDTQGRWSINASKGRFPNLRGLREDPEAATREDCLQGGPLAELRDSLSRLRADAGHVETLDRLGREAAISS